MALLQSDATIERLPALSAPPGTDRSSLAMVCHPSSQLFASLLLPSDKPLQPLALDKLEKRHGGTGRPLQPLLPLRNRRRSDTEEGSENRLARVNARPDP